ncbi:MAG: hydrogenase small subunit [Gemmatimonadota bacterium]|jgi:hydrogenase small subunit|nr:hydrogenase small subunit [Gemmatimonadota bacterium]
MIVPHAIPWAPDQELGQYLEQRGVSRRGFLRFCGEMTAVLGLASNFAPRVARALETMKRPSVIWISLQECTGCTESILRTAEPTIGDLLLDVISLDFQENLMAGAGDAVEDAMHAAMKENKGKYVLVVTGSIPINEDGFYTTVAGRPVREILEETAKDAAAVVAVGACAHWGNVQAARPNPTGAVGVADIIKDKPVVNIAGCPPIGDVITATLVHYVTFGRVPELDREGRPLFAYGAKIHDQCPRRANYDAGQFVEAFDDAAAREGYCLYHVGCKGPSTFSPCPIFQWNTRTSWPIGAGHPCIGCTERGFWDTMTPFYGRLPDIAGIGVEKTADIIGAVAAVGATAGILGHAALTGVSRMRARELPQYPNGPGSSGGASNAPKA